MASSLTTDVNFSKFSVLPTEIRLLVWEIAYYDLPKDRIISLRDHLPSYDTENDIPNPPYFLNDRHALLHTCRESRDVIFPILTSSFGPPIPGYHLVPLPIPYQKTSRLYSKTGSFLKSQGFSTCIPRLAEATLFYYNANPDEAAKHPAMFEKRSPFPSLEPALWFDAESDYLFVPLSRGRDHAVEQTPKSRWNVCGTLLASKVKRLVIEISVSDWDCKTYRPHAIVPSTLWTQSLKTGSVDFLALDKVEEICLWTSSGCELCRFTMAPPSSSLEPGQWSFSLDTTSTTPFSSQFAKNWSNVTWRITFGRTPDPTLNTNRLLNVCELLHDWKPHSADWWFDKMEVTKDVPELGVAWHRLVGQWKEKKRSALYLPSFGYSQVVSKEGGLVVLPWVDEEGRTVYLGPSFEPM